MLLYYEIARCNLQLAACTTCHLPLAAWQLPLATCHLPHATCNSTLTLSWNFSLAKRRNEKREKDSHQSIGNQCELHTTLESTCCSTYKLPRPRCLILSTPPSPLFIPQQARPGPAQHGQLNVHFHVHRRHCEVTINCKHFHFCQWSARGTVVRNCCKKYALKFIAAMRFLNEVSSID